MAPRLGVYARKLNLGMDVRDERLQDDFQPARRPSRSRAPGASAARAAVGLLVYPLRR